MLFEATPRRQLLRWTGWFGAANTVIYLLIASRYLWSYPFSGNVVSNIYALLAFIGHVAFLAYLPLFLLVIPLLLISPWRRLVTAVAIIVMSFSVALLLLDTNVFAQNRYHLTWLTLEILAWETLAFAGIFLLIALVFETVLAGAVRNWLIAGSRRIRGRWIAMGLTACLLVSQSIHVWADAVGHIPVVQFTRYMPLYRPLKAKRALARLGIVDPEQVQKRRLLRGSVDTGEGDLQYPLNPISCHIGNEALPNILIVLIDALRPDTVHPAVMPNLSEFTQQASSFQQHYSGGNSTRMGMFSFFYGLPSTYWQSVYALQRSPVLMDQVKDHNYQMALFSAIGFGTPMSLDRTAFVDWPGLPSKDVDENIPEQNRMATGEWLDWLSQRNADQPIFAYLHYTPPNMHMSSDKLPAGADTMPLDGRFDNSTEAEEAWLRYRRAMQTLDDEFGRVLDSLQGESLADNTIVVVASDHGNEFDDNGLGYMGNGTAFSDAQLLSAMIIGWPGREPAQYTHRTSHHDLPATLLQDVFGCDNPSRDYSVGQNLFSERSWPWMIAGSYNSHAIVDPDSVVISHPGGFVEVRDRSYRPVSGMDLDADLIREAMEAQSRFLR
jgi:membrane-anchored protein YejM (alkaline phosphatase superfamily)